MPEGSLRKKLKRLFPRLSKGKPFPRIQERKIAPRIRDWHAFDRAREETDFVNEAAVEAAKTNDMAVEAIRGERDWGEVLGHLDRTRDHVEHLAGMMPEEVRSEYLPDIIDILGGLEDELGRIRRSTEPEEDLVAEVQEGEPFQIQATLFEVADEALVERYEELK